MRITNKEQLAAHGNREGRKIVAELLDAGLDALDPYVRVKQLVHVENGKIVLHTDGFEMKGDPHAGPLEFDLKDYDRVYVIGAAKGVQRAALAMEEALGDVLTGGHVIAKHGEDIICKKIGVTPGQRRSWLTMGRISQCAFRSSIWCGMKLLTPMARMRPAL